MCHIIGDLIVHTLRVEVSETQGTEASHTVQKACAYVCMCIGRAGKEVKIAVVNQSWHASPAHISPSFSVYAACEWVVDIFVCVPQNLCMYMHEACIHMSVRAGLVGLALGVDWQHQESMLGEAMEGAHPSKESLPLSRFHSFYPSSPLVNYGGWTEEIRAWVWESQGPAPFLW